MFKIFANSTENMVFKQAILVIKQRYCDWFSKEKIYLSGDLNAEF